MPEWDYATLSKLAKEFGGPEQLIATITKNASKAGMGKGIIIGGRLQELTEHCKLLKNLSW